jgi:uncharacterized protein
MNVRFEWDNHKAATNLEKHKVSFDEAATVFNDTFARIFLDENHSLDEHREIIIGHSSFNRLLLVCFTERVKDVIRIISARIVTKKERKDYEEDQALR